MKNFAYPEPPPFPTGTPAFVADLTTWKNLTPHWDRTASPREQELDLRAGWQLLRDFPDPEKLLDSAYQHLDRFATRADMPLDGAVKIRTAVDSSLTHEDFAVEITAQGITLSGGNTEAVRRALYYLEELLAGAPRLALPWGREVKHFWLHNRISRCFFGPIKRAPFFRDELLDDIDYYPEPYLDQLAREGVNGLWLTIEFKEMCRTSFLPEDPQCEQRLAKLRRSVARCRKYGIKIWAFAIEPRAWGAGNPPPVGHPEMLGGKAYDQRNYFCAGSPAAQQYLYESTYSLFSAVPQLGGLLLISHGERPTSCLSEISTMSDQKCSCPRHAGKSYSGILREVLEPMRRGMRDAAPEAELISWFYQPQPDQAGEWIYSIPEELDQDYILAYNFESGCRKEQLGKLRNGGDYWLSCIGPSERFARVAKAAQGHCQMAAKLQVGCSHEVATIPYVPVPGLLYRKYQKMHQLGVAHVMQCWYFGNYPGVMNLAAGHLACEEFKDDETAFLTRLARPEWGSRAAEVAQVWQTLGEAYEHYPLGYEFQYYGPMHDGPVWPLHLHASHTRLPRTWKPETFAAGDAIGECLLNFDLNEAVILTQQLAELWHAGAEKLRAIAQEFADVAARQQDLSVVEALECQFQSGADILLFYLLRNRWLNTHTNTATTLAQLRELAEKEVKVSTHLLELTRRDPRLGYHSEAEVYKYFPAKLEWRIKCLRQLIDTEIPATAIAGKLTELAFAGDQNAEFKLNHKYQAESFSFESRLVDGNLQLEILLAAEPPAEASGLAVFVNDLLGAYRPRTLNFNLETGEMADSLQVASCVHHKLPDGGASYVVNIPLYSLRDTTGCRLGVLRSSIRAGQMATDLLPACADPYDLRLQYGYNEPERTAALYFTR